MDVDDALLKLGTLGKWQAFNFILIGTFAMVPASLNMLAIVWIGFKPAHHCKINSHENAIDRIPVINGKMSSCSMFWNSTNETTSCHDGWNYDYHGSTVVTKWDLVCEKEPMSYLSQSVLVAGIMIGAVVFCYVSDRLGRKIVFLFCQMCLGIVGIITAFSPYFEIFIVLRFFTGALLMGEMLTGFVLVCEMFPARHRAFVGCVIQCFWAAGSTCLTLLAYLIEDWRYLQFTISLFSLLSIPLYWFLRESVLWTLANGRIEETEETLRIAARMNGFTFEEPILKWETKFGIDSYEEENIKDDNNSFKTKWLFDDGDDNVSVFEEEEGKQEINAIENLKSENSTKDIQPSTLDLFKNKTLFLYITIASFMWIVNTLVYYGLVLSTAVISGNRFLNSFLGSFVEFPAYISSFFLIDKFGRKKSLLAYQGLAGVSLLINAYLDREESGFRESASYLILLFNNIGKFGITASFTIVILYTTEIFPTNLRSTSGGICSFFGRAGNFLSIIAAYISEKHAWVCMAFFGVISILAALLVLLLPETLNKPLPQTIEDAINLNKKKVGKKGVKERGV